MVVQGPKPRFVAFGGPQIWLGDEKVVLGSPRLRTLAALLLAARGRVVSLSEIVDEFWPTDPPHSAANQIQRLVGDLRRAVEPGVDARRTGEHVLRVGRGYRLELGDVDFDLANFDEQIRAARAESDPDGAVGRYITALSIAADAVFSELGRADEMTPRLREVERERIAAVIAAAAAAIAAGRSNDLLSLVEKEAARSPLEEGLQGARMDLLVAQGRAAEALVVFAAAGGALASELDVQPGPQLLEARDRALRAAAETRTGPNTLPAASNVFVERIGEHAALEDALADGAVAVAITGMAGMGKTTLATQWAHALRRRYPDGQLSVDGRGFDEADRLRDPTEMAGVLLEALGADLREVGPRLDDRRAALSSLLAGRRMLLLIDNVRDAAQARPFLGLAALTIITSRNQLLDLAIGDGVRTHPLARWAAADARRLLELRIGRRRLAAEPAAADAIVAHCAGLPLALAITAARSATDHRGRLASIVEQLGSDLQSLTAFEAPGSSHDLRTTLGWSYRSLTPSAAAVFRAASVHPAPEFSRDSISSVSAIAWDATRRALDELQSENLVDRTGPDRYRMHDLVKAFAIESLTAEERGGFRARLVDYYGRSTINAVAALGLRSKDLPLEALVPPESIARFTGPADAIAWYQREREAIHGTIASARAQALHRNAALLAFYVIALMQQFGEPQEQVQDVGLQDAERSGDRRLVAALTRLIGASRQSREALDAALRLYAELGDAEGEANVYRNLTVLVLEEGDQEGMLHYAAAAAEAAERSGSADAKGQAALSQLMAFVYGGELQRAVREGPALLDSLRVNLKGRVAEGLELLAEAFLLTGDARTAAELAQQSLALDHPNHPHSFGRAVLAARAAAATGDALAVRRIRDRVLALLRDHGASVRTAYGVRIYDETIQQLREALEVLPERDARVDEVA